MQVTNKRTQRKNKSNDQFCICVHKVHNEISCVLRLRAMFSFQAAAPYRDARGWCNHFVEQMYERDVSV